MQIEADSTSVPYSKFPSYLQPHTGCQFYSGGYDSVEGYTPVGYTAAQEGSAHQVRISSAAEEPHCGEYARCHGITTPSPSNSSHSASQDEANKGVLFRPVDFERFTAGSRGTSMPPTPSDSAKSSDRDSCTEDDLPNSLLIRISRPPPLKPAVTCNETNRSSSDEDLSPLPHCQGITINLLDTELWKTFKCVGNEMIVTKPGRRLFPALLVGVRGLDLKTEYSISLRISSADPYRYKFLNMQWVSVGESEIMQNEDRQIYLHPNSPNSGQFWMKKPISFKQVKITHNLSSSKGNVLLHTMHKYVMEIVLKPTGQPEISIPIPDTEFVAVTAYQNTKITQLKIDNNPFAKGFRDRENAGFHHPSTLFSSPLPLPSLYTSPSGQAPVWHQMPQLACHIPPLPTGALDVCHSRSASPDESYQKQSDNHLPLPTYPCPSLPPLYPYFPPTSWPAPYPQQSSYPTES